MRKKRNTFNVRPLLLPSLLTVLTLSDGCSGSPTGSSPPPPGGQFRNQRRLRSREPFAQDVLLDRSLQTFKIGQLFPNSARIPLYWCSLEWTATMLPFQVSSATGADEQNARYKRQFVQKPETS